MSEQSCTLVLLKYCL